MQPAHPLPEHVWLQKLLGDWTYEHEVNMGPDQPPMKTSGTEAFRSIGGLWFIGESKVEMPVDDGPATMIITIGYDPDKKRYTGTWIGSMMTQLWVYDGYREGDTLFLESEGPSMSGDGTTGKYREAITFISDDHRTFTSAALGPDGQWKEFMTAHYKRKK